MQQIFGPAPFCRGHVTPPGDKSISHRALLFGALAQGCTEVVRPLQAADVLSTVQVLRVLGVRIELAAPPQTTWRVYGLDAGPNQAAPGAPLPRLDCGNSGTTMRLLLGALAGRGVAATLVGDASLMRRPMARVTGPLEAMGAQVHAAAGGLAPITLLAPEGPLRGIDYALTVASAQVKSALLLAALGAHGTTTLRGPLHSRDHTERLLPHFGASVLATGEPGRGGSLAVTGPQTLRAACVVVPADMSSAAFFLAAAAIVPGGSVTIHNVSLNPTRLGFLRLLQRMGAQVHVATTALLPEPTGTVTLHAAPLRACHVEAAEVPAVIDELPLLAVVACCAAGTTRVQGAAELRHKESDRIASMVHNLAAMGAGIKARQDGFEVVGLRPLRGAQINSFDDHRVAMACSVAALVAAGKTELAGAGCVAISYPSFFAELQRLTGALQNVPTPGG